MHALKNVPIYLKISYLQPPPPNFQQTKSIAKCLMPTAYITCAYYITRILKQLDQFQQEMGYTTPSSLEEGSRQGRNEIVPISTS